MPRRLPWETSKSSAQSKQITKGGPPAKRKRVQRDESESESDGDEKDGEVEGRGNARFRRNDDRGKANMLRCCTSKCWIRTDIQQLHLLRLLLNHPLNGMSEHVYDDGGN
jgi:hypothetical protein